MRYAIAFKSVINCIFGVMKNVLFKILSPFMAILILLSTTSWKVEKHYCMGHLVDVAFFVDAQDCGMDMVSGSQSGSTLAKKSCCDDEVIAIEGQNNVKPSFSDFNLEQQVFLVAYTYSYIDLFEPTAAQNISFEGYNPPKIIKNIQLLDAVFLI